MDKLKQAYEQMGLPENASKEDVEKRYSILARQARTRKQRQGSSAPESNDDYFAAVTEAYRLILDLDNQKSVEQINEREYGKYKKYAGTVEKTDHFFRYYKFHLLGGIVAVVLIIVGIQTYLNYQAEQERLAKLPPIDLSVMFIGDFIQKDSDELSILEEALLVHNPEWKRTSVSMTFLPSQSQNDHMLRQKAILILMTEKPDAYIMDRSTFDWLSDQGLLRNLDEEAELGFQSDLPPNAAVKGKSSKDTAEHIYGIDLTSSPAVQKLPLKLKEFIFGIRAGGSNDDKALQFIANYLKSE